MEMEIFFTLYWIQAFIVAVIVRKYHKEVDDGFKAIIIGFSWFTIVPFYGMAKLIDFCAGKNNKNRE